MPHYFMQVELSRYTRYRYKIWELHAFLQFFVSASEYLIVGSWMQYISIIAHQYQIRAYPVRRIIQQFYD